jgi:hypothetical protein
VAELYFGGLALEDVNELQAAAVFSGHRAASCWGGSIRLEIVKRLQAIQAFVARFAGGGGEVAGLGGVCSAALWAEDILRCETAIDCRIHCA